MNRSLSSKPSQTSGVQFKRYILMMIMNPSCIVFRSVYVSFMLVVRVFHQWSYVPVMIDIRVYTHYIYVSRKSIYTIYIYIL
jgi:hypothetical protein